MSNQFFELRPGKGGVPTVFLTKVGADVVFTMRIARKQATWNDISAAIGCPVTSLRRASRAYFGDNPSIFTVRKKSGRAVAPKEMRSAPPSVDAPPKPRKKKPAADQQKVQPAAAIPEPEPKDKLLFALVAAFGPCRPDGSEVRLKGAR